MSEPARLAGRAILIARPLHQCEGLTGLIRAAGAEAVAFPTLAIEPIALGRAARETLERLAEFDIAVFVSANAVHTALPHLAQAESWPGALAVAAIGQATARALRGAGIEPGLVPPEGGDSEALLALPALHRLQGGKVVIFRGLGGRELLADALRARGVHVEYVECYRRILPATDPASVRVRLQENHLHGVVAASAEALRNLLELIGVAQRARLLGLPLFVQHERVAHAAQALGFTRVTVAPLEDEPMIAAIVRVLGSA